MTSLYLGCDDGCKIPLVLMGYLMPTTTIAALAACTRYTIFKLYKSRYWRDCSMYRSSPACFAIPQVFHIQVVVSACEPDAGVIAERFGPDSQTI